jgi:phosphate transporter
MGGIALGNGVMSSGLLKVLDGIIRNLIDGYTLYTVVLILSPVVLVGEIFIQYLFGICLNVAPCFLSFPRSFLLSSVTQ